jgi:hypothetical protein
VSDDQSAKITIGQPGQEEPAGSLIDHPAKLLRIAAMIRELVEEVRQSGIDEQARERLRNIYGRSLEELKESLSEDLQRELEELMAPLATSSSTSEVRVAQAQLLGWLEGLFHGIQAALWSQQMQARAALEEIRRRGLPSGHQHGPVPQPEPGPEGAGPPGQYL